MVVTDDLVVRSLPEISDASTIHPVTISDGKLLFVLDGPVSDSGYEWYKVAPFDEFKSDIGDPGPRMGWVAAGDDEEEWIAPWVGDCPQTLREIHVRSALMALACFGGSPLTVEGTQGDCSYVTPGTVEPFWLTSEFCQIYPPDFDPSILGGFAFHQRVQPPIVSEGDGSAIRVTGHFDDPAAASCVEHELPGSPDPTPPELVILTCRASFVADEIVEVAP